MIIWPRFQMIGKPFILLALGSAALLSSALHAVGAEAKGAPATTPEEARAFLKINRAYTACQQPITLSVTNASLDDIAARVEKQLTSPKADPKLKVQIRGAQPVRFSFVSKGSSVVEFLGSAAMLAQAQLWVFSDHLLIAPHTALSTAELDAVNNGTAIQLRETTWEATLQNSGQKQRAFSTFIGNEIKGMKPPAGMTEQRPETGLKQPLTGTVLGAATVSQLSPEAKAMLEELINPTGKPFSEPQTGTSWRTLTANTQVRLSSANDGELDVISFGPNNAVWNMNWSLAGNAVYGGSRGPSRSPSSPPKTPPSIGVTPIDPSAGKS